MHAHILQHVPYEGPGSIGAWLTAGGWQVTRTAFFESDSLPEPAHLDLLVILGGPMSVNDEAAHAWLAAEKRFVAEAIGLGKAVLGICLGAQLIAAALGARVAPNGQKEIGWFPVRSVDTAPAGGWRLPDTLDVFHWHGETFDLPPGAVRLAESDACRNQAFRLGRRVVGLQFHLETTPAGLEDMLANGRGELIPGRYVQHEAEIRAGAPTRFAVMNRQMDTLLQDLTGGA